MAVIDSDAHVVESEQTWDYIPASQQHCKPVTAQGHAQGGGESWSIDGRVINKGPVNVTETERALREMVDIDGRLRHMDELGTDIQVLFPTIFLRPVTERAEVELALCKSYNRWLADIWDKGKDRLRWAVVLPWKSPEDVLKEMRFGKEHGACAIFLRGIEEDRTPSDPFFFPAYEEATRLDLPICIHAATGNFAMHDLFPGDVGLWRFKVPGINAFHSLLFNRTADRFPELRFGFIELSAQWVPTPCMTRRGASRNGARRWRSRMG